MSVLQGRNRIAYAIGVPVRPTGFLFENEIFRETASLNSNHTETFYAYLMYNYCMGAEIRLSDEERDFFQLVSQATACNPFEDRYLDLLAQIAGDASAAEQDRLVAERVKERVQKLEARGRQV